MYTPRPIDTSQVSLPADLLELCEQLAANAHEVWAQQRLADGWKYGVERNDPGKEHPSLVAYPQLPEAEKQYDRNAVLETLKAITALGHRIQPPAIPGGGSTEDASLPADGGAQAVLRHIEDPSANITTLLTLWRQREEKPDLWSRGPELFRALGQGMLNLGAPFLAIEVTNQGRERWPRDVRLRQIQGLAWARSRAPQRANRILGELEGEGHSDEETLGILARTHKDLALSAADEAERLQKLQTAYDLYARAYRGTGGYWTGINAATLATLLGQRETARDLAQAVQKQCLEELKRLEASDGNRYWALATLGEAALNLGTWPEAERWYREAAQAGVQRLGDLNSSRRQATLLLAYLGNDSQWIDELLRIARVVVFAGHMIDQPGRARPRFPAQLVPAVQEAIRAWLRHGDGLIGYSSAACGSDILFLETVLDLKGEAFVVLPYEQESFARDSVDFVPGADWKARFESILQRASHVVTTSKGKMEGGSVSYDYANRVLHGLAALRADELEADLTGLAVWDGRPGDGPGGTDSVVQRWRSLGIPVRQIDLIEILKRHCPELGGLAKPPSSFPAPEGPPQSDTRVMAMLFADAVGYSKLTEEQVPPFVQHFLGAVADLASRSANTPEVRNTWGDGLYLVFQTVRDAGLFALDLCDLITCTDWPAKGLPKNLNLRIALHAGPVYRCEDPIIGRLNYTGAHVSRAARLEPITPPGSVFASQAFAALASVDQVAEFTCEYVKQVKWAKDYGTFPTYVVCRRGFKT